MRFIDFETRSRCNLKRHGARRYALDPSTEILCAVMFDGEEFTVYAPLLSGLFVDDVGARIVNAIPHSDCYIAHNATFDRGIFEHVYGGHSATWIDTDALARRSSLPGSLDEIGKGLFGIGKDKIGSLAMRKASRPGRGNQFPEPDLPLIIRYCIQDVKIMYDAYALLDWGAPHVDDATLDAHEEINARGIPVDVEGAQAVVDAERDYVEGLIRATGRSRVFFNSPKQLGAYLAERGIKTAGVAKGDLDAVETDDEEVKQILAARAAVARVTSSKARAIVDMHVDGRIYDQLVYFKAHTGRWAGRGVQVQNLPRDDSPKGWEWNPGDIATDADRYGVSPQDVLGWHIRGLIRAPKGKKLVVADWSQIEARILLWVAGDVEGLAEFVAGRPYEAFAAKHLFGIDVDSVTKAQRAVGKMAVLGAGYGCGGEKLQSQAESRGVDFSAVGLTGDEVVERWRAANPLIAGTDPKTFEKGGKAITYRRGGLWRDLIQAASDAVTSGRGEFGAGGCTFSRRDGDLLILIPSGRTLRYRDASIDIVKKFGEDGDALCFTLPNGKRTSTYGGKLCENICQAIGRDILAWALTICRLVPLPVVLHVHDEIVLEVDEGGADGALRALVGIMERGPEWADGLPLAAEGTITERWAK